jgi:hypothetical protein
MYIAFLHGFRDFLNTLYKQHILSLAKARYLSVTKNTD